jgi:hypothetical protein
VFINGIIATIVSLCYAAVLYCEFLPPWCVDVCFITTIVIGSEIYYTYVLENMSDDGLTVSGT